MPKALATETVTVKELELEWLRALRAPWNFFCLLAMATATASHPAR
jgi:hypothetical protein